MKFLKFSFLYVAVLALLLGCNQTNKPTDAEESTPETEEKMVYDTSSPETMIKSLEKAVGTWDKLWEQKDVQFTYTYDVQGNDIKDVSTEKYIFEGEHSWAEYSTHQVNVMPDSSGVVVQYYDGNKGYASYNGTVLEDSVQSGLSYFLRKANYFWFTMMFKLVDDAADYEYLGSENVNGKDYDKVQVTYKSEATGKPMNDTYILFMDPTSHLVDRFYFSLPDFGVMEPVLLMEVAYEEINGLKLPTLRKVYQPDATGQMSSEPALVQTSSDVKFNNGFSPTDLAL